MQVVGGENIDEDFIHINSSSYFNSDESEPSSVINNPCKFLDEKEDDTLLIN